jgi:hypothetical protein
LKVAPEFIVKEAAKVAFPDGAVNIAPEFRVKVEFISKVVNDPAFQVPVTVDAALELILVITPVLPPLKVKPTKLPVEKPERLEPEFIVNEPTGRVMVPVPERVPFRVIPEPGVPIVGLFPSGRLQSEATVFALVV